MSIQTFTISQRDQKLGKYWTVGELWLNSSMSTLKIDTKLVDALDKYTDHFGQKPKFASQNSIYCSSGHSANSFHYKGMAADLYIPGVEPIVLAQFAEQIGMGGIGVYKDSTRHIHIDVRQVRTCWWIVTSGSKTPGFGGVEVVFKKGNRSPAIKDIQRHLNANGFPCGSVDGEFGTKTHDALYAFQKKNGLSADGKFGGKSNKAMGLFAW